MIRHVIIWTLKDGYSFADKQLIKAKAKKNLESLVGKIEGLKSLVVTVAGLNSSTGDMMLDSVFADVNALNRYKTSKEHVTVADTFVRPYVAVRSCFDYELFE